MITYLTIAIILLVISAAYISNYYRGIYLSVFFLLLLPKNILLQVSDSLPVFTIHRFIMILMIVMWLISAEVEKKIRDVPYITLLLFVFFALGISSFNSTYFIVSFKQYIEFLFGSLLFYVILATSLQDRDSFVPLIKTVTVSLAVVAALGLVERYTGFNFADFYKVGDIAYEFEKVQRVAQSNEVQGTYLHRILFGMPMAIGIFYSIMLVGSSLREQSFVKLLFLFGLFGAGLYFSFSRGPWLAFILAAAFVIVVDRKQLARRILFIFFLVALAFAAKPGAYGTVSRLYHASFDESSARGSNVHWRLQVLEMAYTKVTHADSPLKFLFGYGQGSHLFLDFPEIETTTGYKRAYESWDNQVAIILLEHGWIGILLLGLLYLKMFRQGLFYFFGKEGRYKDVVLLALGSQSFLLLMKTNVSFFAPQLTFIEFTNIAVLGLLLKHESIRLQPDAGAPPQKEI